MYFFDVIIYLEKIQQRREKNTKDKLFEYSMLVQIFHTSQPNNLLEAISNQLNNVDEELGNLESLRGLKARKSR